MKLDRGIVNARLVAATGDPSLFAAAYREHVPALLVEVDRLTAELVEMREALGGVRELMKAVAEDLGTRLKA